jgi:phage terminase small subunit
MALNAKQKLFVRYYAKTKNGTEAAKLAGYSPKTARVQASALLTNPAIKKSIEKRLEAIGKKIDVSAENVIREIAEGAFFKGMEPDEDNYKNKLKALEMLGKHLGILDGSGARKDDKGNSQGRLLEVLNKMGLGRSGDSE